MKLKAFNIFEIIFISAAILLIIALVVFRSSLLDSKHNQTPIFCVIYAPSDRVVVDNLTESDCERIAAGCFAVIGGDYRCLTKDDLNDRR